MLRSARLMARPIVRSAAASNATWSVESSESSVLQQWLKRFLFRVDRHRSFPAGFANAEDD
jgi:hypothetical protein